MDRVRYRINIREFWRHLLRYFTHYTILSVPKNAEWIRKNKWYKLLVWVKMDNSNNVYIDEIQMWSQKKWREHDDSKGKKV